MDKIREQAKNVAEEFLEKAKIKENGIVVVGCSSSEVSGSSIGSDSRPEVAEAIFEGIMEVFRSHKVYLAAQCCEHLNRALIIERELMNKLGMDEVNVIPQKKAGGSFATCAYAGFEDAVAVEKIRADGGIDIGETLIGMHLKEVAVPLRLENNKIGEAHIIAARVRPKFVGGVRAVYNQDLL